jgi:hypothetical protein
MRRFFLVFLIASLSSIPVYAEDGLMSCEAYKNEEEIVRTRIVGTYVWIYLYKNAEAISPHDAGAVIATISSLRQLVDAGMR